MALIKNDRDGQIYASVLADGKIHVSVPEGTEGAVIREYENSQGLKGSKTELVYSELVGKITKVAFFEGDFGRQIQVTVADKEGEKPVILSLSTSSNYGEDLMKKLPAVDLEKKVKIVPYAFTDDKGKKRRGITLWQKEDGEKPHKIENYFYDPKAEKNIHGYPEPKKLKKPLSKDQWKLYFGEVREFLVEFITKHFKLEEAVEVSGEDDGFGDW